MAFATIITLIAAVLHAAWNLLVKVQGDRFGALWGQFIVAGSIGVVLLAFVDRPRAASIPFAVASGVIHVPYIALLAQAYDDGDFSQAYPFARGGGALLAAVGGVFVLDDHLRTWSWIAVAVVAIGLLSLGRPTMVTTSLAVVIATYTLIDSEGSRRSGRASYVLIVFIIGALVVSAFAIPQARRPVMNARVVAGGIGTLLVYGLVLVAVRHAPVGYVASLRESSVVFASYAGWRVLHEPLAHRRIAASAVVTAGLVLLVVTR